MAPWFDYSLRRSVFYRKAPLEHLNFGSFLYSFDVKSLEILLPIVKAFCENITASWHGATPESSLLCLNAELTNSSQGF